MAYTKFQARKMEAVTPSDTVDIVTATNSYDRGCSIFVGVGGNIAVLPIGADDNTDTIVLKNIPSGSFLPIIVRRVLATGTTATDIVALW